MLCNAWCRVCVMSVRLARSETPCYSTLTGLPLAAWSERNVFHGTLTAETTRTRKWGGTSCVCQLAREVSGSWSEKRNVRPGQCQRQLGSFHPFKEIARHTMFAN